MATKLKSFRMRVDKLSADMIRETGVEAAKLSPYRTGENASNIHPAGRYERPRHEPLNAPISRAAAINKTRRRLRKWKPGKKETVLSLKATAPYSGILENGSSSQAPTGFMRNAVRRVMARYK